MSSHPFAAALARYPWLIAVLVAAGVVVVLIVTSSSYSLSVKHGQDELRLTPAPLTPPPVASSPAPPTARLPP